jgi:hypothetical protein
LPGDVPNPYAAPRTDLSLKGSYSEPYSIGAAWNLAMARFKEQPGLVIGLVIGGNIFAILLQIVLNIGPALFQGQQAPGPTEILIGVVILVLMAIGSVWLSLGQMIGLIRIARGQPASFSDLFSGGPYIISFILASLLYVICTYLAIGAMLIPFGILAYFIGGGGQDAGTIGLILVAVVVLLVFVMFVTARFYLYAYTLVDKRRGTFEGIIDCLTTSYRITQNNALSVLGLVIVASIVGFLGLLACGVGAIVTGPFAALMVASGYVLLADQNRAAVFGQVSGDLADL